MTIQEASHEIEKMYQLDQKSWKVDNDNSTLIKEQSKKIKVIVEIFGCIDMTRFGEKISHYAWLIVQHANHDIQFQEKYLELMEESGDVLKRDIAYLTDRIAILKGKHQVYGTQFDPKTLNFNYSPYPISDIENLEERRISMGLEPMEDYIKYMVNKYK